MTSVDATEPSDGPTENSGIYSAQISDAGLSVLKGLIGRTINLVYASCLQVAGRDLTAPSLSIPTLDEIDGRWIHRYVVIRCNYFETPKTWLDYWEMLVSDEEKPNGIEVNSTNAIVAPCTINFYHAEPVSRIDIFTFEWSAGEGPDTESVKFDQAIRFQLAGGKSLCVACRLDGPGIGTEVHISEDEETIAEFLKDSRLRLSIIG